MEDQAPRTYYFNIIAGFDSALLENFTSLINKINNQDIVEINLDSSGGETSVMFSILRIINNNPDRFKLIATGDSDSSALQLLVMATCSKTFLTSYAGATIHDISIETNTNSIRDKTDHGTRRIHLGIKTMNKRINAYFKEIGLSESKIKSVEQGEDVEFSKAEIIKACKYREEHNIIFKIN